jgi:pentatricopeptide repeat protein
MQFHLTTQPSRSRVLHYFNSLQRFGIPPSAHTYKLLLDSYATLPPPDLPAMQTVFTALCADPTVDVQGTHWASLVSAYGIFGNDLKKAVQVFDAIATHPTTTRRKVKGGRDKFNSSSSPLTEPVLWESILNVLAQRGSLAELDEMRQRMAKSGPQATAYVNNVLIAGYSRLNRIELAREVFESMGDSVMGVAAPNNHPTLLTSSGHVKPSTVTKSPTGVVYREPSTYEAMVRAEIAAGEKDRAEAVLKRMEERMYPLAVFMRARAILDDQIVSHPYPLSQGSWGLMGDS